MVNNMKTMRGSQIGLASSSSNKTVKREHPLCSRKRPLSRIVASPTYKKRQKKENPLAKETKKEEDVVVVAPPKFKYLERKKKKYSDELSLKKKPLKPKKTMQPSKALCAQNLRTPSILEKKDYSNLCNSQKSKKVYTPLSTIRPPQRSKQIIQLSNVPEKKSALKKRRFTMTASQQNKNEKENNCVMQRFTSPAYTSTIRKSCMKDRRKTTFAQWKPQYDIPFANEEIGCKVVNTPEKEMNVMTPWKNNKMSMRERLDLWLTAKNCDKERSETPCKAKFQKSPHPTLKLKNIPREDRDECTKECHGVCQEENSSLIMNELQSIITKIENNVPRNEIEADLANMISKYTTIVKFADYWICKARMASQDDDVQRVICLLEQAHAFQAQPGDRIKEEICRYLELLEANEKKFGVNSKQDKQLEEDRERLVQLYAITPGRKVHFAAAESPLDFKSSVIRFCLLESKAFKRRLNAQLTRKVITPVRRSVRVETSELPLFLRTDDRVVCSPGEVESDIIDGEISFLPNKTIDTPLNNGWLVQDETNADQVGSKKSRDQSRSEKEDGDKGELEEIESNDAGEKLNIVLFDESQVEEETVTPQPENDIEASNVQLDEIELSFM